MRHVILVNEFSGKMHGKKYVRVKLPISYRSLSDKKENLGTWFCVSALEASVVYVSVLFLLQVDY